MSKSDYKDTVNLPSDAFPMRANLAKREPERLAQWEATDLYQNMRRVREGCTKFVLHDGPPYANGDLHAGTALNKTLKDFVVKSKHMAGFDAPYVPGWDCHGLPIEYKVIADLGDKAKSMSQVEKRQACRAFALGFVDLHREGFKSLFVTGDWEHPYLTLSSEYVATIIQVFAELYERNAIYKGLKPIHWCTKCQTALAEAEVEYADHTSPSVYVKFEATDAPDGLEGKVSYVIWTTTPWTLPANLAICLNAEVEYSAVRVGDETLIMATRLAPDVLEKAGLNSSGTVKTFSGKELEGLHYRHAFISDRVSPIILGDHVTLEAGTGCVHTAPGHGQDDYVVGARYGIEPLSPVDGGGMFTAEGGAYEGQHVFKANATILEDLGASGALLFSEPFQHSYPHCWRCSTPVIFRATPQWFVSMSENGLREKAAAATEQVQWIPEWGKERIRSMIEQRPDWCISRQRAWGVPIPVLYCAECEEVYATAESFKLVEDAALQADDGIDRWFDAEASVFVPDGAKCAKCGHGEFTKETDILDVWFDSGVSNRAVLEKREDLTWPADMYLEGSDQHRGWFQSSLLPAIAVKGEAPYRCVVTHAYVVDGDGRKLSKKLGNFRDLPSMLKKYGAEVIRLWVAGENYRQDIHISDEILKQMQDAYRKFRGTFRYALNNLGDFGAEDVVPFDELKDIDRWALHKMQELRVKVLSAYEGYEFYRAFQALYNFCNIELSSFYFDVLKDRLYTFAADSPERRSAQTVLADILVDLLQLSAPILAHTTDEAWELLPDFLRSAESVHLTAFPEEKPQHRISGDALKHWNTLLECRGVVSKSLEEARRAKLIGSPLEAALKLTPLNQDVSDVLSVYQAELASVFIVSECRIEETEAEAAESEEQLLVSVEKASGEKCMRCWNYRSSVGSVPEHPGLCGRCAEQLGVPIS